jgi:hypothetical protein
MAVAPGPVRRRDWQNWGFYLLVGLGAAAAGCFLLIWFLATEVSHTTSRPVTAGVNTITAPGLVGGGTLGGPGMGYKPAGSPPGSAAVTGMGPGSPAAGANGAARNTGPAASAGPNANHTGGANADLRSVPAPSPEEAARQGAGGVSSSGTFGIGGRSMPNGRGKQTGSSY